MSFLEKLMQMINAWCRDGKKKIYEKMVQICNMRNKI